MTAPATTLDARRKGVPFHRLVDVEFRKLVDTRAGFWLLAVILIMVLLVQSVIVITSLVQDFPMSWALLFLTMSTPLGLLLAVLGIMTVTSEWGQRTSLVTFSLEPRRIRVVAAKLVAGLAATVFTVAVSIALSALANAVYGLASGNGAEWDLRVSEIVFFFLFHASGYLLGFGFGMLVPNTPTAIVLYFLFRFIVPTLLAWASMTWDWFAPILPWINLLGSLDVMQQGDMSGTDVAHLLSSFGVWVVLPLLAGTVLLLRREIK